MVTGYGVAAFGSNYMLSVENITNHTIYELMWVWNDTGQYSIFKRSLEPNELTTIQVPYRGGNGYTIKGLPFETELNLTPSMLFEVGRASVS